MSFTRLTAPLSAAAHSLLSSRVFAYPATRSSAMVVLPTGTWQQPTRVAAAAPATSAAPVSSAPARPATGVWDGRRDEHDLLPV